MNSWILKLLLTEYGRRIQLQVLMNLATQIAGQEKRCLLGMSSEKALNTFAQFTAKNLPNGPEQQKQLYAEAYSVGSRLRKILHIKTDEQLTQTVILLYRNIGIDMQGALPGEVCVTQCFFSRHYTSHLCRLASMMDAGIICGLANNGHFQFSQRITEGETQCKARLII